MAPRVVNRGSHSWSGNLTVVGKRSDGTTGRQVEGQLTDPQRDVRVSDRRGLTRRGTRDRLMLVACCCASRGPGTGQRQELTAGHELDANMNARDSISLPRARAAIPTASGS